MGNIGEKNTLSIIVPVYNVERFLKRGIDSLIHFETNDFEIILVDDGSEDNSGLICDEYANDYKNIHAIHQKNRGVSSARNIGLKNAKGKYIAFFDPDDYISETFYSRMLQEMQLKNLDIIFSGYVLENNEGEAIPVNEEKIKHISDCKEPKCLFVEADLSSMSMGVVWRSLFRKDIILKNHIFFDEELTLNEDQIFLLDYLNNCSLMDYLKLNAYHYCLHEESATGRPYKKNLLQERIKYLKKIERVLEDSSNTDDLNNIIINRIKYKIAREIISNEMNYYTEEKDLEELKKYIGRYFLSKNVLIQLIKDHNGFKTTAVIFLAKLNGYKVIRFLYRKKCRHEKYSINYII